MQFLVLSQNFLDGFMITFFIFLNLSEYYLSACRGETLNKFIRKHLFIKHAVIATTLLIFFPSSKSLFKIHTSLDV